jgi:DNA polymerase/3'-5' exonuclease PolX
MVEKYYKKSGIKIPVDVKFARVKSPAKLKTKFNSKTKQIISNTIQIDDTHYKTFAKIDIKRAKIYLQHSVAHELGHLKRVQDDWNNVRKNNIRGMSDKKEEDFADNYARKLTGISNTKFTKTLAILQQEYDERNKPKELRKPVKRTFTREELAKWSKRLER